MTSWHNEDNQRLDDVLRAMGISKALSGYRYIREAVKRATVDPTLLTALTTRLYPVIALKFSTTPGGVERSIRYAVDKAWTRSGREAFKALFAPTDMGRRGRPTNGAFIAQAVNQMKL